MASAKDDKQFKYDAGNTLLALREKAGLTQPELAEKMFRPIREPGLLCELLGDNPVRRTADLKMNFDFLVKDLYENEVSRLI